MKHPNREQWIGFLYEDCDAAEKIDLAAHLETCAECRSHLQTWRNTMGALNEYRLPAINNISIWKRTGMTALRRAWLPLSAAAAMVLVAGVLIGSALQSRGGASQRQTIADLRARLEKSESESARTQKLLTDISQAMTENRARDQAALIAMAQQLKATRKDLETVAALTEVGLKSTQNELVRLASYTP
jgi:anti-sigma factor ChrR (cupin superfamily)